MTSRADFDGDVRVVVAFGDQVRVRACGKSGPQDDAAHHPSGPQVVERRLLGGKRAFVDR